MKVEKITKEKLIEFGFKITEDNPLDICQKELSEPNEDDGLIMLVLTRERNKNEFAIRIPDGILFLNANLEQLTVIEKCITGYEPNY
jgi:hypothetical protein